MKCPKCNSEISLEKTNQACKNCNFSFTKEIQDKLSFYYDLNSKINSLDTIKEDFNQKIISLKEQVTNFEVIINNELEIIEKSLPDNEKIKKEVVYNIEEPKKSEEKPSKLNNSVSTQIKKVVSNINWEMFLGFNGFLILGVISIIFGVGFFIRKAFVNDMLGPIGKVSIIYLGSFLSLALGDFFRKKNNQHFGQIIIGMGIALLYYSTYAAFHQYLLFSQILAFSLMVLITTFAVFIAVIENNKGMAVLALIGGFSTPILLDSGISNNLTLFSYITILNLGLLVIAFNKKWNLLNNLGFIFTYILFLSTCNYNEFSLSTIFLNIFFFIYSLVPFMYQIFKDEKEKVENTWIIFLNSFIAVITQYFLLKNAHYPIEMLAIFTILYAFNFILMSNYLFKKGKTNEGVFIFTIAKASLFLIITVPMIFSREIITVFWLIEALILLWISKKLEAKKLIYASYIVLVASVSKFFFYDYDEVFNLSSSFYIRDGYYFKIFERLFTEVFLIGSFFAFLNLLKNFSKEVNSIHSKIYKLFSLGWLFALFVILNVEVTALFHEILPEGIFVAVSVLWASFAVTLMYLGLIKNIAPLRKISIGLFFLTMGKVFFVDIAKMDASYKFISFIILGLILILTSFLYGKFKEKLIPTKEIGEKIEEIKNEET